MQKRKFPRLHGENLRVTVGGTQYGWAGFGDSVCLTSSEKTVKASDVRVIGGVLFYASRTEMVGQWGSYPVVYWSPVEQVDEKWTREFKAALFGCEESSEGAQ